MNFLIELISGDVPQSEILCSLETGDHNLGDLKEVVHRYHKLFKGVSPMVGDFRGKWTLPMMYLDAYVDEHGKNSVQEGVDAPISDDDNVLDNMKWFMKLDDDTDGYNKGERDEYDSPSSRDRDIAKSDHIMLYGYSELLSQVMSDKMIQRKHIHASCIIAPTTFSSRKQPPYLHSLMQLLSIKVTSCQMRGKTTAIVKFLKFYTSLSFRNKYAEGQDLKKPHPPSSRGRTSTLLGLEQKIRIIRSCTQHWILL